MCPIIFYNMSTLNFTIPSDSKILEDINITTSDSIKFIGLAKVCQNIKETTFVRMIQFNNESTLRKVVYQKKGRNWGFRALEEANF